MLPQDLGSWYVRNGAAQMVPFSAFARGEWTYGSPKLERYNGLSSVEILGAPASGRSTGEAMAEMERLAAKLPHGIGYDWTGLSYEEKQAGSKAMLLYMLSIAVVFLCLAALYESWQSRRQCCSSSRSESAAPCWLRSSAASTTTSTSRWACSPRWDYPSKTPSSSWSSLSRITSRGAT